MTYKNSNLYRIFLILFTFLPFFAISAMAEEEEAHFDASPFILDHIVDSYGWHITTINEHEISISLPIILFDEGKPVCFMSKKFHHGHSAYKGYALGFTEETKGKIVKLTGEYDGYSGELNHNQEYTFSQASLIDISITKNVCSLLISILLMLWICLATAKCYKKRENQAPKGFQALMEILILFIRDDVARPSIGEKKYEKYMPYLLTLFIFILLNNIMGLIPIFPGGANLTGNIAITGILAFITFFITTFSGNKHYWKDVFNTPGVPWWLKFPLPLMPIVEVIGLFTKPIVLMIRLFANITAGHIIVLGFIGLIFIFGDMNPIIGYAVSPVSLILYLFMGLLELLVAFIQAFVFTLLSALYIGMAVAEHHEEHEIKSISEEIETI